MFDWVFIDAAAYQRALGFGFIIALFVAFASERFPPVMIAVVGAGAIIVFGWPPRQLKLNLDWNSQVVPQLM